VFFASCGGGSDIGHPVQPTGVVWQTTAQEVENAIANDPTAQWTAGDTYVTTNYSQDQVQVLCGISAEEAIDTGVGNAYQKTGAKVPATFNWRNFNSKDWVTTAKNQGLYGTCVAFAEIGALEVMDRLKLGNAAAPVDFSEWYLWYKGTNAKNPFPGGWGLKSGSIAMKNVGTVDEVNCRYSDIANFPSFTEPAANSKFYYASDYTRIPDMASMKEALQYGPIVGAMPVYTDFFFYKTGIYKHVIGSLVGYHAILIVGYDDTKGCWIAKNSWSDGWGENGFFNIQYNQISSFGYLLAGVNESGGAVQPIPLATGNTWTALRDDNNTATAEVTNYAAFQSYQAYEVMTSKITGDPNNWKAYLTVDNDKNILFVGGYQLSNPTTVLRTVTFSSPIKLVQANLNIGQTWSNNVNVTYTPDTTEPKAPVSIQTTCTVVGNEVVTVPYGTLNCSKISIQGTATLKNGTVANYYNGYLWINPAVGPVQFQYNGHTTKLQSASIVH
jgi:hypothetical protein